VGIIFLQKLFPIHVGKINNSKEHYDSGRTRSVGGILRGTGGSRAYPDRNLHTPLVDKEIT